MSSRRVMREKDTDLAPRETKEIIDRLVPLMTKRGTNPRKLSKDSGLGETFVVDLINSKNKSPSIVAIKAIARQLGSTVAYLMGETDYEGLEPEQRGAYLMAVSGVAEAGAFRKALPFDTGEELQEIYGPRSRHYPKARHFALEVRGHSMNAATGGAIEDGMYALCVDMAEAEIGVESGKIYAIRRTMDAGQTWEITIKRVRIYRDRYEYLPESTNPAYEKIIVPRTANPDPAHEIEAFGLVFGAVRSFE